VIASALLRIAATPAPHPVDRSRVQPGWIGFAFLVGLLIAVVFLWFSMRKHLRRIDVTRHQREHPPPETDE